MECSLWVEVGYHVGRGGSGKSNGNGIQRLVVGGGPRSTWGRDNRGLTALEKHLG